MIARLCWSAGLLVASLSPGVLPSAPAHADNHPNVVLIITDDQGYGDLSCHGNPVLPTPALDQLHAESARLTNYHVDPTCAPTRSALMTGRYSSRTGVWHTIMGRSLMAAEETTVAEVLADAGYTTAFFGKWHLGDNYPMRPEDQGFEYVLRHGGGGVGQTPDYWGNTYFDDTYWRISAGQVEATTTEPQHGYCTDIWFSAAEKFIADQKENRSDKPFFCEISTNAPHGPYRVDAKYSEPFRKADIESPRAEFYGMIANIDENVGRLRVRLAEWGLADNTIFIFTTDNGTAAGAAKGGFNAEMRGQKGSEYDGGHRVPFLIHWPGGGLNKGRDIDTLTAHIDILPTLTDLCGVTLPDGLDLDGTSLKPLLMHDDSEFADRTLVVHSQRVEFPEQWRKCSVMTQQWRLVNGRELFDMQHDPGQKSDVATGNPGVVATLRESYEAWYQHVGERFEEYVRIPLTAPEESSVLLTSHDWHTHDGPVPWNHAQILKNPANNGYWAVEITEPGTYQFELRTRPAPHSAPINAAQARVRVGQEEAVTAVDDPSIDHAVLELSLPKGEANMQTWFDRTDGKQAGAYFVHVKRIGD